MIKVIESYGVALPANVRKKANRICQRYSGWHEPKDLKSLWDELLDIGIDVGMLTNRKEHPDLGSWEVVQNFKYNGETVNNSSFVFTVYEGNSNTIKNEYNIYVS